MITDGYTPDLPKGLAEAVSDRERRGKTMLKWLGDVPWWFKAYTAIVFFATPAFLGIGFFLQGKYLFAIGMFAVCLACYVGLRLYVRWRNSP